MHVQQSKILSWIVAIGFAMVLGLPSGGTVFAQGKVDICHFQEDKDSWKLISIGGPALDHHLTQHDDALPGGNTISTGTLLDADCVAVTVSCPCFSVGDIVQIFSDIRELADGVVTETCALGATNDLPGTDIDVVRTTAEPALDDTLAFAEAGPVCVSTTDGVCTQLEKQCRLTKFVLDVPDPQIDVRSLTDEEIAVCKTRIQSAAEIMGIQCN